MKSGNYKSASEVIAEALRLLEQRDCIFANNDQVRTQIEQGWQSAQRGELVDGAEVFDRIDTELEGRERAAPE
ncbi:MAG TPA: type II toxin-antitoxin system ParD family antitoxin [Bryobacteraceae bacterium]|nr:type II toxin-antitoxin system ParD family antitoxin [Bryobacteraceae bacterium]